MNSFVSYLKPYFPRMGLGLSIKFLGTIMDLLIPWILAYMLDYVVPAQNIQGIFHWGLLMLLCATVAIIANITANRMAARVARDTTERIRYDLFEKISHLSSAQMDTFTLPSLISRLTSDTYHVHHMIGMLQRLGVRAPILLIGGIIVTLLLDTVLALVLIAVLPFIALTVYVVTKKGLPLYGKLQKNVDTLVRITRENITGIRVIKALSKTEFEKERFKAINDTVAKSETHVGTTMALTNPMMNLLLNLGLTLVVLVGAFRVHSGNMLPGTIIAFLTYFTLLLNAMLSISRIFVLSSKGYASFLRIDAILKAPEDLIVKTVDRIETDSHVWFDQVSFSYHKQQPHLKGISFALRRGETLGIIGSTGSGKSSIIKLLMRFYDPDQGAIRINGQTVDSIPRNELHTKFGVVFQNDALFKDTIAENITFGRDIKHDELSHFTHLAQAGEFIDSLHDGYAHQLDVKGANLSGGQKQRLLISRALIGEPEILILDDASSALDYKTDALLRQNIANHFKDTTSIIVAQRISSIMHANHIIVLEDGEIIGQGTHDALMKTCDHYKDIYTIQMGGGTDGL